MSWETLVVGHIQFKEKIDRKVKKEILDELETAVECEIKYDRKWHEYVFQDVNWTSHVSGEDIAKVVEKYKKYLEYVSISVYYLDEPHENIVLENGKLNADVIEMW